MPISFELLKQQNAETSNGIISGWGAKNSLFQQLAAYEGKLTADRDEQDAVKLKEGIQIALDKGVLTRVDDSNSLDYKVIDVLSKTPSQVVDLILTQIKESNNNDDNDGSLIILCGASGTGKGTTVSKLKEALLSKNPKVMTWSNGNIFRSVTLLATTWYKQQQQDNSDLEFDATVALTKQRLQSFMEMLSFEKKSGEEEYDIFITGLDGHFDHVPVSSIQNTTLKEPIISRNIPTVAQACQGEVVLFASRALEQLQRDGWDILLEGRRPTVDYIGSSSSGVHRFMLELSDNDLIGQRRAAQRLMAATLDNVKEDDNKSDAQVMHVMETQLKTMVDEMIAEQTASSSWSCFKWLGFSGNKK